MDNYLIDLNLLDSETRDNLNNLLNIGINYE